MCVQGRKRRGFQSMMDRRMGSELVYTYTRMQSMVVYPGTPELASVPVHANAHPDVCMQSGTRV
eukprot:6191241-Pleurochrysis_carterae.AAC.4